MNEQAQTPQPHNSELQAQYQRPPELQERYDQRKQDQVLRLTGNIIDRANNLARIDRSSTDTEGVWKYDSTITNDDSIIGIEEDNSYSLGDIPAVGNSVVVRKTNNEENDEIKDIIYVKAISEEPFDRLNVHKVYISKEKNRVKKLKSNDDEIIDNVSASLKFKKVGDAEKNQNNGRLRLFKSSKQDGEVSAMGENIDLNNTQVDTVAARSLAEIRGAVAKAEIAQSKKADKKIDELFAKR